MDGKKDVRKTFKAFSHLNEVRENCSCKLQERSRCKDVLKESGVGSAFK